MTEKGLSDGRFTDFSITDLVTGASLVPDPRSYFEHRLVLQLHDRRRVVSALAVRTYGDDVSALVEQYRVTLPRTRAPTYILRGLAEFHLQFIPTK